MTVHSKKFRAASALFLFCALLFAFPAQAADIKTPVADGLVTYKSAKAVIDASHTSNGYVMVCYSGSSSKIKVQITKDTKYTYNLNNSGNYETFPLTEGNGSYNIKLFERVSSNQYTPICSETLSVTLTDDKDPFLYPNQFCSFSANSSVVAVADSVTAGITDTLKKAEAVYNYTVNTISYDYDKAASVQNGYLPDVDAVLSQKTGICFDYAALMTSMLRIEGIPSKLIIGYSGSVYHAWVSVYSAEQGWIDNLIFFDGNSWSFMDPTFASSGKGSSSIREYISNSANYKAMFAY